MKTSIKFVIFKGEVLAVFMRKDSQRRFCFRGLIWLRACYAHVGQHSECYDGMKDRKRATPNEYRDLKSEMETLGYIIETL